MQEIWIFLSEPHDKMMTLLLLILATYRIWLEIIGFDFKKLPLTAQISQYAGECWANNLHQWGLFFSIGYILLFAPSLLLN